MKIVAYYLPQYHRVKENDEWWGEGYTDWIAVQKALPLYENHKQPHIPYRRNYYDLLDINTLKTQQKQIARSGLDGLCFYHYWFKDGRRILERPSEMLLANRDIQIPFCFSWANETWARTWSNIPEKNSWAGEFEKQEKNKGTAILLDQKYGGLDAWKEHFEYLLPFFKDDRYLKIDGKPIFGFHKANDIHCLENMIDYWQELAIKNGFEGMYFVGNAIRESQRESLDLVSICQPGEAIQRSEFIVNGNGIRCYDYPEIYEKILAYPDITKTSVGGFVGYDDTPRHGNLGVVIEKLSIEEFKRNMKLLIDKNKKNNADIMFINAWNEWGEGMYLEPDEENGYKYIETLKSVISNIADSEGASLDSCVEFAVYDTIVKQKERELHIERILDKWMQIREENREVFDFLKGCKVLVYGYGVLGRHLLYDLKKSQINVVGLIDKNTNKETELTLYKPDDKWPNADVIVVAASFDYGYIYRNIRKNNKNIKIISLEHVIMDC